MLTCAPMTGITDPFSRNLHDFKRIPNLRVEDDTLRTRNFDPDL